MIARLEFDLYYEDDRIDFDQMYHAPSMATALCSIRNAVRWAEKNDDSLDALVDRIRDILADLPESITG